MNLLTEEEREYIERNVQDFIDTFKGVTKEEDKSGEFEHLIIQFWHISAQYLMTIYLKDFEKGKCFKGLQLNKLYTLEELGL